MALHRFLAISLAMSCALSSPACARVHSSVKGAKAGTAGRGSKLDAGVARVGTTAVAKLEPVQSAASTAQAADAAVPNGAARKVMGTATFSQRQDGVNLSITVVGCVLQKSYDVFILDGTDCDPATLAGPHWDVPRGEGLSQIQCTGTSGGGRAFYSRATTDAKPWTIDGPSASDLVGHAIAVFPAGVPEQALACGVIEPGEPPPELDAGKSDARVPPVEVRAALSGLCLARMIVRSNTQVCPDPAEFQACASANCDVSPCLDKCAAYTACLETAADVCGTTCSPQIEQPCSECMGALTSCTLGFCSDRFACAAPIAPGGPCAKLEACCGMQGDSAASCLDTVHLIEKISGDPSCVGVMSDWDTTSHLPVPCNFQ